ncbi:MAG: hypothetical protein R6V32_06565 [Bacteroidales bacterium]
MAQSNAFKPSLGRELLGMLSDVFFPRSKGYEKHVVRNIRKANQVTKEIRELIDEAKYIDPRDINSILKPFRLVAPLVNQSVESVEELPDEYLEYKNAIRDLRNAFNQLLEEIEYQAEKHGFSALSTPVLSEVWCSPEDEVWDNF